MPKKLYLLRHAKSDWSNLALSDHGRPLNDRGRQASDLIGSRLAQMAFSPDIVLCSTAQRTVETLERLMSAGRFNWHTQKKRDLYHASANRLLKVIHQVDSAQNRLLLVGHNPGIQDLAVALTGDGDADQTYRLGRKLPTGSFVSLEFDVDCFSQISVGTGRLRAFMRPKHEFLQ